MVTEALDMATAAGWYIYRPSQWGMARWDMASMNPWSLLPVLTLGLDVGELYL